MTMVDRFIGKLHVSVAPEEVKSSDYEFHPLTGFYWGTQLTEGTEKQILVRKYKRCQRTKKYFEFLQQFDSPNIVEAAYMKNEGNISLIAFNSDIDCTLQAYLLYEKEDQLVTGNGGRFQHDLCANVISIIRQIYVAIEHMHEHNVYCGKLHSSSVYLKLGEYRPRVMVLPTTYETRAQRGDKTKQSKFTDDLSLNDWVLFGEFISDICEKLGLKANNSYEIFHLISMLKQKIIKSSRKILMHPSLLFEDKKLTFLVNMFESIFLLNKEEFLPGPYKLHAEPAIIAQKSWRLEFAHHLNNMDANIRDSYNMTHEDPDCFYHFIRFIRNVLEHFGSDAKLKNNFGDKGSFLRSIRLYYPNMFYDLMEITELYSSDLIDKITEC